MSKQHFVSITDGLGLAYNRYVVITRGRYVLKIPNNLSKSIFLTIIITMTKYVTPRNNRIISIIIIIIEIFTPLFNR